MLFLGQCVVNFVTPDTAKAIATVSRRESSQQGTLQPYDFDGSQFTLQNPKWNDEIDSYLQDLEEAFGIPSRTLEAE